MIKKPACSPRFGEAGRQAGISQTFCLLIYTTNFTPCQYPSLDTSYFLVYDKNNLPDFNLGQPLSRKKLLLLGFLFILILVIPLTVYLVKQQQDIRIRAEKSTTLSFSPTEDSAEGGSKVKFDIFVSPGVNQIGLIKLVMKYDSTKISTTKESFELDKAFPLGFIQNPEIGPNGDELSFVVSTTDPTKVITQETKLGTVTFDVIATEETTTQISFDSNQIQIRGIEGDFTENVFLEGAPATLTITSGGEISPTPTPTPTTVLSPTPTPTETSEEEGGGGAGATPAENQAPVCQSLEPDKETTGEAPLSITFTVNGTDADGTLNKVTFNFGEGAVEDETSGGGIGTSSVSLSKAHTYQNSGTFTASAILTDDRGGTSSTSSCTATITVSGGVSVTSEVTPLPATGPTQTIVGVGILGGILFLIGTLLFFAL